MKNSFEITAPRGFSFRNVLHGHGWSALSPFETDYENLRLTCVFAYPEPVSATLEEADPGCLAVTTGRDVSDAESEEIAEGLAHILRFDDDLADFHRLASRDKRLKWAAKADAGRFLRSPTVFEDLVKTLCTTNCSWSLTKIMVRNLVDELGARAGDGRQAFPVAGAMAKMDENFFREKIRAGYRAPYFAELAKRVADGDLDPESWLRSELPTSELKKEIKKVKGVGDYAAENLLKLLGRFDGLALDSWLRGAFYKTHRAGETCDDKEIAAHYESYGEWRGLAIWCDLNAEWYVSSEQ